ncbi:outer membrane protein assembly factor BamB family protein [Streptomyces sp. NBC_01320]|uniref:outer membrane protein assembly factor BamB family protein n=1 Tax=Streptomyces sp. NBC_01320 TaxID=2903824 RepID=UPI002E13C8EA|nr:PQQ-binding-like beta-propeller repeat protein [Streptomyces sp. NBC_01320]
MRWQSAARRRPAACGRGGRPSSRRRHRRCRAGTRPLAIDLGRKVWSVADRGFSAGRAACDGQRVYTAADDGYARAHDAATGKELWSYQLASGDEFSLALHSG